MGIKIKCVVWDLDNTIWDGTLLEADHVSLKDGIVEIIKTLDSRGILQSIASKNEFDIAYKKLIEFDIAEYFLFPQISWNSKADSIKHIAESLNIGLDTILFVDDSETELEEIRYLCPEARTLDALKYTSILQMDDTMPKFITEDSARRRLMYMDDSKRNQFENEYVGSKEEFLATLDMELTISKVSEEDLQRVEELTIRTNQLNSTGYTFSYEELAGLIDSDKQIFLIAELSDKFGNYGKIGLVLLERTENGLLLKLLLMSCRVMTKGIGSAMLVHIIKMAQAEGEELYAEFKETDRNRVMYIIYKMMGFIEAERNEGDILLKYESDTKRDYPSYIKILK